MAQGQSEGYIVQVVADVGGLKITNFEYFSDHDDAKRFAEKMADYGQVVENGGEWALCGQYVGVYITKINIIGDDKV